MELWSGYPSVVPNEEYIKRLQTQNLRIFLCPLKEPHGLVKNDIKVISKKP